MKQVPLPDANCEFCNEYDWIWNETGERWECKICNMSAPVNAEEWVHNTLREWESSLNELEIAKELPQDGEAEKIMWTAKVKKAERNLAIASLKAEIADTLGDLIRTQTEGNFYIHLPDIDFKVHIQW